MKSFITAVILTAVIVGAVLLNSFCANRVYDTMLDALEGFPQNAEPASYETIRFLSDYFEEKKYYLYRILPQCTVNELMGVYTETVQYCLAGDDSSYRASLEKTKLLLKAVKDNEGLRFFDALTRPRNSKKRYFP